MLKNLSKKPKPYTAPAYASTGENIQQLKRKLKNKEYRG